MKAVASVSPLIVVALLLLAGAIFEILLAPLLKWDAPWLSVWLYGFLEMLPVVGDGFTALGHRLASIWDWWRIKVPAGWQLGALAIYFFLLRFITLRF